MLRDAIDTRLNRCPRRNPQRIYAASLIQDLRDMAALDGDRQPDKLVLDLDRTAAVEAYFGVLKRINDLSRILFASLGLCQARVAFTRTASTRFL